MNKEPLRYTVSDTCPLSIDYLQSLAIKQGVFVSREGNTLTISDTLILRDLPDNTRSEHQ